MKMETKLCPRNYSGFNVLKIDSILVYNHHKCKDLNSRSWVKSCHIHYKMITYHSPTNELSCYFQSIWSTNFKQPQLEKKFKVLENSFEECMPKEYPTFAPPSSSIKLLIKNSTK